MLSPEEREEIEEALRRYEDPKAACIDALKAVQGRRGWVSDEAVVDIAAILRMDPAEVDGVATFYNMIFRRPVGRHVILLCDSVTCWMLGEEEIRAHLSRRLGIGPGETTPDGMFTLLPVPCLGACDHAPAMMIDEELLGDLTPERIDQALAAVRERSGGQGA